MQKQGEDYYFDSSALVGGILSVNARIVDFAIHNQEGMLVLPPMRYNNGRQCTLVDLNGWNVGAEQWKVAFIPAYDGRDAKPGLSIDEYLVELYMARTSGLYYPFQKTNVFELKTERNTPSLGGKYYASGISQTNADGTPRSVIIPAFGAGRQYLETLRVEDVGGGVLYHFQVYAMASGSNMPIYNVMQDSLNYAGRDSNAGQRFVLQSNLAAKNDAGLRLSYQWRVRASYKNINPATGEMYWSNWSPMLPFKVNVPPPAPYDLSVAAN